MYNSEVCNGNSLIYEENKISTNSPNLWVSWTMALRDQNTVTCPTSSKWFELKGPVLGTCPLKLWSSTRVHCSCSYSLWPNKTSTFIKNQKHTVFCQEYMYSICVTWQLTSPCGLSPCVCRPFCCTHKFHTMLLTLYQWFLLLQVLCLVLLVKGSHLQPQIFNSQAQKWKDTAQ